VLDGLDVVPTCLLPREIGEHLASDADWLPEVLHVAALLAVRDVRFGASAHPDDDFLEWLAQLNRELLDQPLQGLAASPAELAPHLVTIWEDFHAGTPAAILDSGPTHVAFALSHPAALFHPLSRESQRRVVALALVKVGAVQPDVAMRVEPSRTIFDATWR
jgi:hypothetical protein